MKKNKGVFRYALSAFLIMTILLLPANLSNYAAESENVTVRVGIYPLEPFMSVNEKGEAEGYAVDYLEEIAKYAGWNYEYVSCNNWGEAEKLLAENKIDIIAPVLKSKEREEKYFFPEYSAGTESAALYVKAKDDRYFLDDYKSFNDMRVALLKNNENTNQFIEFSKNNGFSIIPQYYDTVKECFDALDKKEVDGVASGGLSVIDGYRNVCDFSTEPYYFVTSLENNKIGNELNDALGKIAANDLDFQSEIYHKYYVSEDIFSCLSLTRQEQELINGTEVLNVAFIPNRAPFSYMGSNGKIQGISYDIVKTMAELVGVKVNCVMMKTGQTPMEYLESNPDSLVVGIMTENAAFKTENYIVSNAYYTDDVGLVCKKGMDYKVNAKKGEYTLVVPKSYSALSIFLEENCPQFEVKYADSVQKCLNMVESGKADFAAQNVHVLTPMLSDPHFENLTVLPTFLTNETMGFVSLNNEDNVLWNNIINKCIEELPESVITQFTVDHMIVNGYKTSLEDFIYKFRYALIIVSVLLLGIVVLVFAYIQTRRKHLKILEDTNSKLEVAIRKANQASESKGTFLAQMSHEIRTPMNAIIGLTTLAHLDINSPEKMEEYLTKVDGSSKILLGIINDVLDMSKIETNKLKIDKEPFDFKQLLTSIVTIYYQQCKQKGIDFELKMEHVTEEHLNGDSLRVNQIILNLLSNAVKFTPSGGKIKVTVIQASKTADQIHIRFKVADTGCGISEDLKDRLFLPFEQEDASTARKHGGSGLGLAISKNLTELMGGEISVESKKNEGSTFIVDIPFGRVDDELEEDEEKFADSKVLIVDDDEESCHYIGMILELLDVKYKYVTDGEEALEELGEAEENDEPYNFCIVDWKMPKMSGVEVTEKIREIFGNEAVVVIVSAYDLNEIEAEGRKAGADYFIPKPLFQSTLHDVISRANCNKIEGIKPEIKISEDYQFAGKRVLIAEDVVLNMEVAVRLMELVGIQTECAEDGKQALDMFEKSEPGYYDVILMDINMPVMDGYESAKRIRASLHPDAKNIIICAMTANAFSEDVSKCLNVGMNGHIAKPIETKVLYKMLDEAFEKTVKCDENVKN